MQDAIASGALPNLHIRLKSARLSAGLTLRDVASSLKELGILLTFVTLANYERGETLPTISALAALASIYNRPLSWFLESGPKLTNVRYRNLKSRIKVTDRQMYEANAERWLEAYVKLERRLGRRLTQKVSFKDVDGQPKEVAAALRERLGFNNRDPIPSVVEQLEKFGIRTLELPTDLAIYGLAARFGEDLVVVFNSSVSADRIRLTAAHEMIHVVLGHCDRASLSRDEEAEAYQIGSHFLLPESELENAFKERSAVRLLEYKERFGISMQAMIYRATESGLLSDRTSKWLWMQFARRGWRRHEPGDVRPDRATRFEQLLESAINARTLRWSEAEAYLGIRQAELRERLSTALRLEIDSTEEEGGEEGRIFRFGG